MDLGISGGRMASNSSEGALALRKRVRARNACDSCRKRKRRCDGSQPCAECVGYDYACSFEGTTSKAAKKRQTTPPNRKTSTTHNLVDGSIFGSGAPGLVGEDFGEIGSATVTDQSIKPTEGLQSGSPMWEPWKCRYMNAHSAVSFPRSLGLDLEMDNPPRLHAFAWHTGIRTEYLRPAPDIKLYKAPLESFKPYFDTYFEIIHPVYGIIDLESFLQRCKIFWATAETREREVGFEAVVCGVVILGSLFSKTIPCAMEGELEEHSRKILDSGVSQLPAGSSSDFIVAWILRAIYLRSTSRPILSWMASCTSMHLAEAIGLHREIDTVQFAADGARRSFTAEQLELRRRVFWVGWSLNQLFAAEYGRTRVHLDNIKSHKPLPQEGDFTYELIAMAEILANTNMGVLDKRPVTNLEGGLRQLSLLPASTPPTTLLKADICLCLCRLLRLASARINPDIIEVAIPIFQKAFLECRTLSRLHIPWWNILSIPFNIVCFFLSVDTRQSIRMLPEVMDSLEAISVAWDTHLSRETLRTARLLVSRFVQRKREDLALLDAFDPQLEIPGGQSMDELNGFAMYDDIFEGMNDTGWMQFFGQDMMM